MKIMVKIFFYLILIEIFDFGNRKFFIGNDLENEN